MWSLRDGLYSVIRQIQLDPDWLKNAGNQTPKTGHRTLILTQNCLGPGSRAQPVATALFTSALIDSTPPPAVTLSSVQTVN